VIIAGSGLAVGTPAGVVFVFVTGDLSCRQ
jgi:hypothetical protein